MSGQVREEMVGRTVAWTRRRRSCRLWPLLWRGTARERSSFLSVPMRPIVSGLWARAVRVDAFVSICACVQRRALVGDCDHYRGAGQSIRLRNLIGLRLSTLSVVSVTTQDKITPETLAPSVHHPSCSATYRPRTDWSVFPSRVARCRARASFQAT